jgi:hypothetical protein
MKLVTATFSTLLHASYFIVADEKLHPTNVSKGSTLYDQLRTFLLVFAALGEIEVGRTQRCRAE